MERVYLLIGWFFNGLYDDVIWSSFYNVSINRLMIDAEGRGHCLIKVVYRKSPGKTERKTRKLRHTICGVWQEIWHLGFSSTKQECPLDHDVQWIEIVMSVQVRCWVCSDVTNEHDSDLREGGGMWLCTLVWAKYTCVQHFETWVFSCVLSLTAFWSNVSLSVPWSPTTLTYARLLVWDTSFTRFTVTGRIISVYFSVYFFRQPTFR